MERLSLFLKKKYQININSRTLGRIMNKLGFAMRNKKKQKKKRNKEC
ncbi:hypothetical protein [Metamycoplasma hominis]|nr:hypothetical protein [Metamycoplasma hominis]